LRALDAAERAVVEAAIDANWSAALVLRKALELFQGPEDIGPRPVLMRLYEQLGPLAWINLGDKA
jgi:hypothetical protein